MDYPETLTTIIREAATAHPESIDAAVELAANQWRECEERDEWLDQMELGQIRTMVQDVRHSVNVALRREAGIYGGPAKVSQVSAATEAIATKCLLDSYTIAGRPVGNLLGKELTALADAEQAKAEGSAFNARFLRMLAPKVPADKAVREAVSNTQATKIFKACGKTNHRS